VFQRKVGQNLEDRYLDQDHDDIVAKIATLHSELSQNGDGVSKIITN